MTQVKGKVVATHRVIVTLRIDGNAADKNAVTVVQDRIIATVTKLGATVERRYSNIPQLALAVTPQALAELRKSSDVLSIHEDIPQPPMK